MAFVRAASPSPKGARDAVPRQLHQGKKWCRGQDWILHPSDGVSARQRLAHRHQSWHFNPTPLVQVAFARLGCRNPRSCYRDLRPAKKGEDRTAADQREDEDRSVGVTVVLSAALGAGKVSRDEAGVAP